MDVEVNYKYIEFLHQRKEMDELKMEIQRIARKPPPERVDVEEYLNKHLNNNVHKCSMVLQERTEPSNRRYSLLTKDYTGSDKCCVVVSFSPRGSGKTHFVKHFFFTRYAEAIKRGRVIVRCCVVARKVAATWLALVEEGQDSKTPVANAIAGLCELIRSHVESVTGRDQRGLNYSDSKAAYATWMRETALFFDIPDAMRIEPLIVLDSCEVLGEHGCKFMKHTTVRPGTPYSLRETFCLAIPAPHRMFAIGCNGQAQFVALAATSVNIDEMTSLLPLSAAAHRAAVKESWGKNPIDQAVCEPIYRWAAGWPRLLIATHCPFSGTISLANGSVGAVATKLQ